MTVRLPADLLEEALRLAPPGLRKDRSRLVARALQLLVVKEKRRRFAESMAAMAKDPQAMALNRQIAEEFSVTDADGLVEGGGTER